MIQVASVVSFYPAPVQAVYGATKAFVRWPISPYPYIAFVHAATRIHPRHLLWAARLFRRGMA